MTDFVQRAAKRTNGSMVLCIREGNICSISIVITKTNSLVTIYGAYEYQLDFVLFEKYRWFGQHESK